MHNHELQSYTKIFLWQVDASGVLPHDGVCKGR